MNIVLEFFGKFDKRWMYLYTSVGQYNISMSILVNFFKIFIIFILSSNSSHYQNLNNQSYVNEGTRYILAKRCQINTSSEYLFWYMYISISIYLSLYIYIYIYIYMYIYIYIYIYRYIYCTFHWYIYIYIYIYIYMYIYMRVCACVCACVCIKND